LWGGLADYVYSLYGIPEGAERDVARHEVHLRSANRLQDLCFKNGGIYIKLGQHIGQLDYLVPEEYVKTMRKSMLDKCPVSSYKQVCDVFLAELGCLPQEVWSSKSTLEV
jgi:aarF domain-containing kinase